MRQLALWILFAAASFATASAQVTIPLPGTGGNITIGPSVPGSIYITGATYGGNCGARRGNLMREMIDSCAGRDVCTYPVDMRVIGDPRPGCPKDFQVSYVCREGTPERSVSLNPEASGQSLFIDCRR